MCFAVWKSNRNKQTCAIHKEESNDDAMMITMMITMSLLLLMGMNGTLLTYTGSNK